MTTQKQTSAIEAKEVVLKLGMAINDEAACRAVSKLREVAVTAFNVAWVSRAILPLAIKLRSLAFRIVVE